MEYQNDEVSSSVCQAILKQAYMRFRLFMGSFETILEDPSCGSVTLLRHKLDYFYSEVSAQNEQRRSTGLLIKNKFYLSNY